MIHYLPSCKVKENLPEASIRMQSYLKEKGIVIEGCCKLSQKNFQKNDIVINNCTSCAIITDEQSPFVEEISLYEYLLTDTSFPWPDFKGERMTIQDCYRTIHKPEVQKAIRKCLKRMNIEIVEIEENYEKTRFDGIFKFNSLPKPAMNAAPIYYSRFSKEFLEVLPAEQQKEKLQNWCKQFTTDKVVTYCNSCYKGVQLGGANGIHIIELLVKNL